MTIDEALAIVVDLAEQNILDFDHQDDELNEERAKQNEAVALIREKFKIYA